MNQTPTINPRVRRAEMESKYITLMNENPDNADIQEVKELVTQLLELNKNGSKKDFGSQATGKTGKLLKKYGERLENDDFNSLKGNQILSLCINAWIEGLKKTGYKNIYISDYDDKRPDLIIKGMPKLSEIYNNINEDYMYQLEGYSIVYNYLGFRHVAKKLGLIIPEDGYSRVEKK